MKQIDKECVCLRASDIHGKGLFAERTLETDVCVLEYAGAVRRWSDYTDRKGCYACLMGLGNGLVIDPRIGGNIARYINHCCVPNCEALIVGRKIYIYSTERIEKGEELTIDYSLIPPRQEREKAREKYKCACGSPQCRGTMLMKKR